MATQGLAGFRLNNEDYLTYIGNSEPYLFGGYFLYFLKKMDPEKIKEMLSNVETLSYVPPNSKVMTDFFDFEEAYKKYTSNKKTKILILNVFITNSKYCEWAYIYNLDSEELEVYIGRNVIKALQAERYAIEPDDQNLKFYSCRLFAKVPYDSLDKTFDIFKSVTYYDHNTYIVDEKVDPKKCFQAVIDFIEYGIKNTFIKRIDVKLNENNHIELIEHYVPYEEGSIPEKMIICNKSSYKKIMELLNKIKEATRNENLIAIAHDQKSIRLIPGFINIEI